MHFSFAMNSQFMVWMPIFRIGFSFVFFSHFLILQLQNRVHLLQRIVVLLLKCCSIELLGRTQWIQNNICWSSCHRMHSPKPHPVNFPSAYYWVATKPTGQPASQLASHYVGKNHTWQVHSDNNTFLLFLVHKFVHRQGMISKTLNESSTLICETLKMNSNILNLYDLVQSNKNLWISTWITVQ